MQSKLLLGLSAMLPLVQAEDVLGVYIFHRHGDRTAKSWPPVNLTALGADQAYSSGQVYRTRYVASDADRRIRGLSSDIAVLSQLQATSSVDNVLHSSAVDFLQGLYPPTDADTETLANGTKVEGPLDGYQTIPVNAIQEAASGDAAESNSWLQGNSGCGNAVVSSNNYLKTDEYKSTYDESKAFYQSLLPVINGTFDEDEATFENGYTIFDLINVASIHNSSIASDDLLTKSTLTKLYDLASTHEWNLAYNSSDTVRAIAGSVLAGQIVEGLTSIVEGKSGASLFNIQFGAYGSFMSFFGLAQLPAASSDFYGICDYASSMTFELVTNATNPTAENIGVRFYFSNGTAAENELAEYPLFGQEHNLMSWEDFAAGMNEFAVEDTKKWCEVCGNTDGTCASSDSSSDDSGSDSNGDASSKDSGSGKGNGVSKPVAGVIGALVTLVVILGLEAAVMFIGGLRLVKKSTLVQASQTIVTENKSA